MNNKGWYLFFSILSYVISTMASITFVLGLHVSNYELVQLSSTCILFMAGAWFTLKEASAIRDIKYNGDKQKLLFKHKGFSRFCYIGLYFICTIFSIFTTANMAFEAINKDSDYKTVNSDSYKLSKASKELSISTVQTNNEAITSLLKEKQLAVSTQLAQVEKWKTTAVTQRQKEIDKANSISSSYDSKIESIRSTNSNMQSQLSTPIASGSIGTAKQTLVDMFPEVNFMKIIIIAILIMGVGIDLLGAFFTIQYSKESFFQVQKSTGNNPPPTKKPVPEFEQNSSKNKSPVKLKLAHANNILSFAGKDKKVSNRAEIGQKSGNELSNPTLKKYINAMYETEKNNVSAGYKSIAKSIGLTGHKASNIVGHLEHLGIVKVDGVTKILVTKEQALQMIRKGA